MAKENKQHYQVLARKYRSQTFNDLIGQEVLVRTLTNAIKIDRLAHAYILTGIRGTGKTSTARILAKALNCIGPDGKNTKPTVTPCGVCEHCRAITEDRHVDVIEMDAASRTGVEDIRTLTEGSQYKPTSARFKVYIIDEVHMLSNNAFNALLKTLEEPPEHVKFIFATTEIRKVPVTVLSRCQRFDLARIDIEDLAKHFKSVAEKEGIEIEDEALNIIARAAEGSARDGISILDQAISHTEGKITAANVSKMLGLADRTIIFDLFECIAKGATKEALELIHNQYHLGADPIMILNDLIEFTHYITKANIIKESIASLPMTKSEQEKVKLISEQLSIPFLSRIWQMLLKGLEETSKTGKTLQSLEMIIIRICYSSGLPTPDDLIKKLKDGGTLDLQTEKKSLNNEEPNPNGAINQNTRFIPKDLEGIVKLLQNKKELIVAMNIESYVRFISLEGTHLKINLTNDAPSDFIKTLTKTLIAATKTNWIVEKSTEEGALTIKQQKETLLKEQLEAVKENPIIKEIFKNFPNAKVDKVV